MSEEHSRDGDRGRAPDDMSGMFSRGPGGDSGPREPQFKNNQEQAAPVDEDAAAKHAAAKKARVRARRDEMRRRKEEATGVPAMRGPGQGGGPGGGLDGGAGGGSGGGSGGGAGGGQGNPGGGRPGRGSALPALRSDIRPDTPALRAERVEAIRRDLVRRRRRKGLGTLAKLFLFVLLPTMLVAGFLYTQSSAFYRSDSSFSVKSAEAGPTGGGGLLGSLMGGGVIYDPIAVQSFITSRDVLKRLDAEHAWIAHFQDPALDVYHRLDSTATFEEAYSHYKRFVWASFDPSEGIIKMSLVAATPEDARRFSLALIGYAEEMVDKLSSRIRKDALTESEAYFKGAQDNLREAQLALAEAQKLSEVFSVETEVTALRSLIGQLESQREQDRSRLASLLRVTGDDDPRVTRVRGKIASLDKQINDIRAKIVGDDTGGTTLADVNAKRMAAQLDLETKTAIFTSALQRFELAKAEADRQQRYLAIVSSPSMPDRSNYPKKLELTALAFLCFLGFYIISSLTISLIREQASI